MRSFSSVQKLALLTALCAAAAAGWLLFSSEANTDIALTLTSNKDLERGLLAHWSFDGTTVSSIAGSGGSGGEWDVSTAVYANKSKDVFTQATNAKGVTFSSDGTKMYVGDVDDQTVYQYTVSTPWDVSTASYASKSKDVSAQGSPDEVIFNDDGTKMYIIDSSVYQYTVSTPWDVSTASYASKSKDVSAQESSPGALFFSTDGTKMYVSGANSEAVYQYTVSTPWDVSTASYASKSKDVSAQTASPMGLAFSSDGTSMYVTNESSAGSIYQYTVSTPWDVSTASYASKSINVSVQVLSLSSVAFSGDGTAMYVVAAYGDSVVRQYTLGSAGDQGSATVADQSGNGVSLSMSGAALTSAGPLGQAFRLDGSTSVATTSTDVNGVQSIAFWAAPDSATQKILELGPSGKNVTLVSGTVTTGLASPTIYVDGTVTSTFPNDNEWHHVVVTTGTAVNATDIKIGMASSTYYAGSLDDVRFYSRALAAEEVKRLYELGATTRIAETVTSNPDLERGLVGHYTFDGEAVDLGSSTREILDRSGQGNHSNWNNHASTTVHGVLGQALRFDGVDDVLMGSDIDALDGISHMTVSVWLKQDALRTDATVATKWTGVGSHFFLGTSQSFCGSYTNISFVIGAGAGGCLVNVDAHQPGVWEHWVMVFDGTQTGNENRLKVYKNGTQEVLDFTSYTIPALLNSNSDPLTIGDDGSGDYVWNGLLDDVRLYSRALTAEEVKRLYQLGATTRIAETVTSNPDLERGLIGHWTFDGSAIDRSSSTREVLDSSPEQNHGDWQNHSTTTAPGVIGQALQFGNVIGIGSTKDQVLVADPASGVYDPELASFSYGVWFKTSSSSDTGLIKKKASGAAGDAGWFLEHRAVINGLIAYVSDGTDQVNVIEQPIGPFVDNAWHHSVVVIDRAANTMYLYMDGVEVDSVSLTGVDAVANALPVTIGAGPATHYSSFPGRIDDVRVYNRALSPEEVTRLYEMGL